MRYFEDIKVGDRARYGAYAVTREEVIDFASKFDPQPFHLDDEAAAKTYFGRLSASGWHTCAMMMRMMADQMKVDAQAGLGSPGIDELRWLKPVYPGDTLSVESEITATRASASKPHMGFITSNVRILNQHGDPVMTMISTGIVATRASRR
jgi:acyl dehydratase